MEKCWNYIYYTIFNWYKLVYKILSYIDPFRLFYKIPAVKKFYAKGGIEDMNKFTDDVVFNDNVTGMNNIWASIQMGGLLVLLEYSFFNLIQASLGKSLIQYIWESNIYKWIFIIGLLVIPYFINNSLLWKKDKYLVYFKKFDKEPKQIKNKWAWISFGVIIGILSFFILSFVVASSVF